MKPRLLGHFGTVPGLNILYAHLNRQIRARDLSAIYVTGPGHGGPALVANAYLEGTYSELYPNVSRDLDGLRRLFRQFSFPGGIPSHVAPEVPGSIHEGGELGYALVHAFGAAFDNPDLLVACVVGDGEAETGPLAASWHSNKLLNPKTDGAVLPVLHLNGFKIANPTVLARIPERELVALFEGYGWRPLVVSGGFDGEDPAHVHRRLAAALDEALDEIREIQRAAREDGVASRPTWPMLILRTPKGWTGPKEVDGKKTEGSWRSHQVPMAAVRENPAHVRVLEDWLRSYRPEELFDDDGRLVPELAALAPAGERRMSANPHANGGALLRELVLPDFRDYAVAVPRRRRERARRPASSAASCATSSRGTRRRSGSSAPTRRPRTGSATSSPSRAATWLAEARGRRRGPRSRRARDGGPVRAPLPGLAGGLPAHRQARPLQLLRGVHPHRRLDVQPAREVAEDDEGHPLAPADRVAQLPALARTCGARITTASRTRTRASSTTSSTRRRR